MSQARQIIEQAVAESAIDIDQVTWENICDQAGILFRRFTGRSPEIGEMTDFHDSLDAALEAVYRRYAGGHHAKVEQGDHAVEVKYGWARKVLPIVKTSDPDAVRAITSALNKYKVKRSLGGAGSIARVVSGVRLVPTVAGNEAAISVEWPSNRMIHTHPEKFDPKTSYAALTGGTGYVSRPSSKPQDYSEIVQAAKRGEKLDVVMFTRRTSPTHMPGDQRLRSKLRELKIPHKRASKQIPRPDDPLDRDWSPSHETHVWVNCKPGDPDARQVRLDNRIDSDVTSKWRRALDHTWKVVSSKGYAKKDAMSALS